MARVTENPSADLRAKLTLEANSLKGRRIIEARYLTDAECHQQAWSRSTLLIVLDNGTLLFPMRDDEGNDAGSLMVVDQTGHALGMPTVSI